MMSEKTNTHSLIAAIIHQGSLETYRAAGIRLPPYNDETDYDKWKIIVERLIEGFPQLLYNQPMPQPNDTTLVEVERAADRHTHWSNAIQSPDGCIDRHSVDPYSEGAWAKANHGKFDPTRVAQMQTAGYRVTRVRVDHDPLIKPSE